MLEIEIWPQSIAERKSLILQSMLDYGDLRFRVETVKTNLLVRHFLSKPKFKDISFLASNKCYEPYFVIGRRYSLDYWKRNTYALRIGDQTQKVCFGEKEFSSAMLPSDKLARMVKIEGKQYVHYQKETYVVLDRVMREVSPEELPMAPFASEMAISSESNLDLRKVKISLESEIAFLRSRLVKIPSDVSEIIRQNFEITQRLLVYKPFYELTFENIKSGEVATALIDGITGKVLLKRAFNKASAKLEGSLKPYSNPPQAKKRTKNEATSLQPVQIPEVSKRISNGARQNNVSENHAAYLKVQFVLGCLALFVGLLAANLALFGWTTPADSFYFLGDYARYACAYGGLGATIFGSMMVNDFIILRSRGLHSQSSTAVLEKVESEEQIHFVVSKFEEEEDSVSQVSSERKR